MAHARADEEGDSRAAKSRERCGKGEGAGAALRGILLRQPESIDGEIGAAQAQKKEAGKKPGKRARAEIEDFAERERDKYHHQRKVNSQRAASSHLFGKPGHRQAA